VEHWKSAVYEAMDEYNYLQGDDCRANRNFMLGFAECVFRQDTGRYPTLEEQELMIGEINDFLQVDVNKSIRLLDAVLLAFVDDDPHLSESSCECCKYKRELLVQLKEAGLVK